MNAGIRSTRATAVAKDDINTSRKYDVDTHIATMELVYCILFNSFVSRRI